jgi:tRNA threonylcarbamoyladenosine biosynthesis protein TsaE
MSDDPISSLSLFLSDPCATKALAIKIGAHLQPGDTVLLTGPIGAGKSHLARALIHDRLARENRIEDIPSPTFTLVQTYETSLGEIWHADLYRLSGPDEVFELGLSEAFDTAICLIEWPDRLGSDAPAFALSITLTPDEEGRIARIEGPSTRWTSLLESLE